MTAKENIQLEYERVVKEQLPFEFIQPDSFGLIIAFGEMKPTRREVYDAMAFIRQYRMMARRSEYRLQEGRAQPESYPVNGKDAQEREYQKNLTKKLLVSNWYFKQAEAGVNKLFLRLAV